MINKLSKLVKAELKKLVDKNVDLNLMVSGGVDSAVLLAELMDMGIPPDRLITVRLPYGEAHDEFDYLMRLVDKFKLFGRLTVIELDDERFFEVLTKATKAIGKPIPHYNIFPLYVTFEQLSKEGVTDVVVGDGPDESMCGYTRHLIMDYLYGSYEYDGFEHYSGIIDKVLTRGPMEVYSQIIDKDIKSMWDDQMSLVNNMCNIDMIVMREDMMAMSHGLAKHFGIKIHAPYEEEGVDNFMFSLPKSQKIKDGYGKYLLRVLGALRNVPHEIIWRKHKIGGPVVPVNKLAGWDHLDPYDKSKYIEFQKEVLND